MNFNTPEYILAVINEFVTAKNIRWHYLSYIFQKVR